MFLYTFSKFLWILCGIFSICPQILIFLTRLLFLLRLLVSSRFLPVTYLLLLSRPILWDLCSAIPLTYWVVESITLSNGLSLLFLIIFQILDISPTYEISLKSFSNESFLLRFKNPFSSGFLLGFPLDWYYNITEFFICQHYFKILFLLIHFILLF